MKQKHELETNPEANHSQFDDLVKANKCLKNVRCRDQYTRYNIIVKPSDDLNIEFRYKIGFSVLFYVIHACISYALSSS